MKINPYFTRRTHRGLAISSLLAATYLASYASAQQYFQAPFGPGGTWRVYEINPGQTLSFREAHELARSKTFNGVKGHLPSVTSEAKSLFLRRNLNWSSGDIWIGLVDREGILELEPGEEDAQESMTFGTANDAHRRNGWKFTNKDPYGDYMSWNEGEPNDAGNGEDAVHMNSAGGWNDNECGYGYGEPIIPVLQAPETSSDETQNPDRVFRYIIEYLTHSPTPLPNVRYGQVVPPGANFGLPLSTTGHWSVRVFRDLTMAGNIMDAVDQALAGEGYFEDAQVPIIDFTDPDTNPAGGPILLTEPIPFPTETAGDDDHILMVAQARVSVTTPGEYTIQVRSDDGFVLRFPGLAWSEVAGGGYIDPLDPSALVYDTGTGDSNTRAVITLPAGEHDVQLVYWEGGGGAFCELTSASGKRLNAGEAQWLPLGSNETLPEKNLSNAVHLVAPATVANVNFGRATGRDKNLPALRKLMEFLIDEGVAVEDTRSWLEIPEYDMPGHPGSDNWDYYFIKVTGRFTVDADANGNGTPNETIDVTFGLFCDDGCSLRIKGQDFIKVSNFTNVTLEDNEGDMTLTADFPTGNSNAYGLIQLQEGQTYEFEAWMYELEVGSNFNLRWQLGDKTATGFDGGQVPLSDAGDVISLVEPATIIAAPNNPITIPYMQRAIAMANEAVAQNLALTGQASTLILRDTVDGGTMTGAPYAGTNAAFPVGGADYYLTKVSGRLKIDNQNGTPGEALTITFCMFSDDGSAFRIIGQDFSYAGTAGTAGGPGAIVDEIGGDLAMVADVLTGNADALGVITLTEGEYDFEGYHFENTGGSGYEIWWALGEYDAFDPTVFRPLSDNPGDIYPPNIGLPLVAGVAAPPAGPTFAITNFTFNPDTGAFSVTFESEPGATYALDYTLGFLPSGTANAAHWNIAPGFDSIASGGATTTINGNISTLLAPGGTLPDNSRCFFRVRKL